MSNKLPYGQAYKTIDEVKAEIKARGASVPENWEQDTVVSHIGIYNTRTGILSYWLIGTQDEEAGR